jgi:hypothetical protein
MPLLPLPDDVVAVHAAATEFEAIAIRDLLEAAGVRAMVRSRRVPGYEVRTMLGDQAGIAADILVLPEQEAEARVLIEEYLASLEAGYGETGLEDAGGGGPGAADAGVEDAGGGEPTAWDAGAEDAGGGGPGAADAGAEQPGGRPRGWPDAPGGPRP